MIKRLVPIVLFASACAGGQPPAPPAPVEARVSRILPQSTALSTSRMSVKVEVYNPRAEAVGVKDIAYALDTKDVAGRIEGTVDVNGTLEPEQRATLDFDVDVPLPKGSEDLARLGAMEVVPADLSGQVRISDGSSVSFTKKSGLAIPTLPQFIVFDAQAARYEKKGLDVTLILRLVNENGFTLPVQSVAYTVEVSGKELRSDEAGVGTRLTAGAAEEYEVSLILDDSSYDGVDALLRSGVVDYIVQGKVQTKDFEVPFRHAAKIELAPSSQ
ncbi:MAG: LEA type 2 family protein [Myxococcota bacterium]